MMERSRHLYLGWASIAGGAIGLVLAPIMVIIKYMTGWAVVPEPFWVDPARVGLGALLEFATPPGLWVAYGSVYTGALLLMLAGFMGLSDWMRDDRGRVQTKGYWIVLAGLLMVIPGDALHTWTWHQNGLTTPTPGTNPLANTAYAVHMMGMNFIMAGTMVTGVAALRRKLLPVGLAWTLILIFPSAVTASLTLLPTTPAGALWLFCIMMIACGYHLGTGSLTRGTTRPTGTRPGPGRDLRPRRSTISAMRASRPAPVPDVLPGMASGSVASAPELTPRQSGGT